MAEGKPPWMANVLCRYYLQGVCRAGPACGFSHDLNSQPSVVCKYYLRGGCAYGDKCRYDHVRPSESNKKPVNKSPEQAKQSKPLGPQPLPILPKCESSPIRSHMVTLRKQEISSDSGIGELEEIFPQALPIQDKNPDQWVKAAEFIPGQMWKGSAFGTYLDAAQTGLSVSSHEGSTAAVSAEVLVDQSAELCPYAAHGGCWYGENCSYMHGDICDLCGKAVLHPTDEEQRNKHHEQCMAQHEEDMELSFAIARSKDKTCGICMEEVFEKKGGEARFGILSACSHVFCITCIRKWRQAKHFENKIIRACPQCRVKSDFVTPSKYWVENKEEKEKIIEGYKNNLREKPCKYFDQGKGECPFNENCFYKHAYPDGRIASPKPVRRRRKNAEGDLDIIGQLVLWDFLDEHRRRFTFDIDLEDEIDAFLFHSGLWNLDNSSDDSDYSDMS